MFRVPSARFLLWSLHRFSRMYARRLPGTALILLLIVTALLPGARSSASEAAGTPALIAPADNAVTSAANHPPMGIPEFSWTKVEGATEYRIQLSRNIGFNETDIKYNVTTALTRFIPNDGAAFVDGEWYWRVRVEKPEPGDFSTEYHFTKQWAAADHQPALELPAEGATLDFYDPPAFSWEPVVGAASYDLQIDSNPAGFSPPPQTYRTLGTTFQPELKLANGIYYWRVVPSDGYDHAGTPSEVRSFTMSYGSGAHLSEVPGLIEPANGSTPIFTPTFRWQAVRGAEYYLLQYSTSSTFQNAIQVKTYNTAYTPTNPLANDINYYWRVQAVSGASISDWSTVYIFRKSWNIQPTLLTPTVGYSNVRFPFFSWTPVPGASYYRIEVAYELGFSPGSVFINNVATSNTFFYPETYYGGCPDISQTCTRYWRVTPYDSAEQKGKTSSTFSFISRQENSTPVQIYPFYYYTPDTRFNALSREDRTVPLPIFVWHRLTNPIPQGGDMAAAYRIQVGTTPSVEDSIIWSFDTENTSAAPTLEDNFTPQAGRDYYWRVSRLSGLGGNTEGAWSQVWRARVDLSKGIPPTTHSQPPSLLRPAHAAEIVETTPLLEWIPIAGADSYQVVISTDPEFDDGYTVLSEEVPYSAYTPQTSLAQRSLGRLDFGSYYWRVRAVIDNNPAPGGWSEIRRFQIAAQSEWAETRTSGDLKNRLLVAADPEEGAVAQDYELTNLYASQDSQNWYFGFDYAGSNAMTYGLYLDLDHKDESGGDSDPRGYAHVSTHPAHRPEYAIYLFKEAGGTFSASQVFIYRWDRNLQAWSDIYTSLEAINGELHQESGFVEIRVPGTLIGHGDTTGSYSLALFSISNSPDAYALDTVPSSPEGGSGWITRFASVSERMNLIYPFNTVTGDPTTYPSVPPFFYDYPTGHYYNISFRTTPWVGAIIEAHRDQDFTTLPPVEFIIISTGAFYASTSHAWPSDFSGDNTYYWRARPRYLDYDNWTVYYGVWTQGSHLDDPLEPRWRFVRQGFVPYNLQESVTFATPTFSWDRVEGAAWYELQVDDDSSFGTPTTIKTAHPSYTLLGTLKNGTYYWRLRVIRYNDSIGQYSQVKAFTLTLPVPANLTPNDPAEENPEKWIPTLCWDPLVVSSGEAPVLAAYQYSVQVSKNPALPASEIYDSAVTQQSCWTPRKGYENGTYYWHVAMVDGTGLKGDYSPAAKFVLQYPVTTPVSPVSGVTTNNTPTFVWTPVEGAALYRLEVSLSPDFSSNFDSATTGNTRFTPVKVYPNNIYYWRVAIIDKDGRYGPFTTATLLLGITNRVFLPLSLNR